MRIKPVIENALRAYPLAFRLGSKVYHALNPQFRAANADAPEAIGRAMATAKELRGSDPGDYYEFGLFRGYTFLTAYRAAEDNELRSMRFHGFDSFKGLPEAEDADDDDKFFEGQFACSLPSVKKNLTRHGMDLERANLVEGYYSNTLTQQLHELGNPPFRRAAVVMLDCDLYSSTRDALNWLTRYLDAGTVLVFDDWYVYGDETRGQPRALHEWLNRRQRLRTRLLFHYGDFGRAFVLEDEENSR